MSRYSKMKTFLRKWKPVVLDLSIEKGVALGFKVEPVVEMPALVLEHAKKEGFKPRKPDLLLTKDGDSFYLFLGNSLAELYYLDRDVPRMGIYKDLDDDVAVRERLERILNARFNIIVKGFDQDFSKTKHIKRASVTNSETGEVKRFENKEMIAEDELNRLKVYIRDTLFQNPN